MRAIKVLGPWATITAASHPRVLVASSPGYADLALADSPSAHRHGPHLPPATVARRRRACPTKPQAARNTTGRNGITHVARGMWHVARVRGKRIGCHLCLALPLVQRGRTRQNREFFNDHHCHLCLFALVASEAIRGNPRSERPCRDPSFQLSSTAMIHDRAGPGVAVAVRVREGVQRLQPLQPLHTRSLISLENHCHCNDCN